MAVGMSGTENYRRKFQELLRQLFQFDCADLDFGIYRIMNYKRDVIERFIENDLIKAVSAELDKGVLAHDAGLAQAIEETREEIQNSLGEDALDGDGNLKEQYQATKVGKRYLDLQAKGKGAQPKPALEAAILSHLFTFFNRYYDNGDFMSKRRYSKKEKYAIPYNGEEVYLHWANSDQYYIKTGEYFTDYTFVSGGISVHFKLQAAEVEQDNVKSDKRFFVPLTRQAAFDASAKAIVISFEFRPLTEQEEIGYGQKNQQEAIIAQALEAIPKHFGKDDDALRALTAERRKTSEGTPVSSLEHHLRQYTRRNTSDFFIHKDLKGFLERELDFYLKNEVLNLDEMQAGSETGAEGWFQIMRVIKSIGQRIVAFLAQIENFQKRLFEKKKFVLQTNYCITVGRISQEFFDEIAANDAQWEEWKALYHIDEAQKNMFNAGAKSKKDRRVEFIKSHPTLVLDTRYFDEQFNDRILASFDELDDGTDGLLLHGENFQALSLLAEKYYRKVECIYVDPPYNTGDSQILYKNEYLFSSWLTLMDDRLVLTCISL
jgi:adenine-specific DNA-methyltransferase